MPSILFVCLGNICRSPMAEGAMRDLLSRESLDWAIDSAGTGNWHVGNPPDRRAIAMARKHGVDISGLRARQIVRGDFERFDHVIGLDRANLGDLRQLAPADAPATLSLLLDHAGRPGESVADPYYGDESDFELAWRDVSAGVAGLVSALRR